MRARDRARDARDERRPNAALQADAAVQRHRAKFGPYAHELNCGRGRGARRRCEGVLRYGASFRSIPNAPLPALEPLLRNKQVAKVISTYLGGGARFDGHVVLELSNGTSIKDYLSGYWHHDRCGRRLKLFIFLHDVKRDGRPTVVAAGARHSTTRISPRYRRDLAEIPPTDHRAQARTRRRTSRTPAPRATRATPTITCQAIKSCRWSVHVAAVSYSTRTRCIR